MADETEVQCIRMAESNIMALRGATQRSFDIIFPLSTAKSNYKEVQIILRKAHKGGTKYITSVSENLKRAESVFGFAKRAQDLCIALASGREKWSDELIHDSIAEMRDIAQKAHADTKITKEIFDANRREFTAIRACASDTLKAIKTKRAQVVESRDNAELKASSWKGEVPVVGLIMEEAFKSEAKSHAKKAISCEEALQNLESVGKDLERLKLEMDVVASHWLKADMELKDIDTRVKALRDDHMLQMRIKWLKRDWEGVARDHNSYITALDTPLNNDPQYKGFVAPNRAITLPTGELAATGSKITHSQRDNMIEVLSGITESMRHSKQYLDDLQEASIKASGNKNSPPLPQIVEIRQDLQLYWTQVANFMQVECYQTVNEVACLQDATGPTDLISATQQLEASAKECSLKAEALIGQHDVFMRSFGAGNLRFLGSDALIASFMQACGDLRAGLIDLLDLIEKQREACAAYQTRVRTNYKSAMLDEFTLLGKQWKVYAAKAKETYSHINKLSHDIMPA